MGLPTVTLPRATAELPDGSKVEIRALTRAEVMKAQQMADPGDIEIFVLSRALDEQDELVRQFYESTSAGVIDLLLQAIRELSGLGEDGPKG